VNTPSHIGRAHVPDRLHARVVGGVPHRRGKRQEVTSESENQMSKTRAENLKRGDIFRLHVAAEVLSVTPVTVGKKMSIKVRMPNTVARR
jgi:hypothetical protein